MTHNMKLALSGGVAVLVEWWSGIDTRLEMWAERPYLLIIIISQPAIISCSHWQEHRHTNSRQYTVIFIFIIFIEYLQLNSSYLEYCLIHIYIRLWITTSSDSRIPKTHAGHKPINEIQGQNILVLLLLYRLLTDELFLCILQLKISKIWFLYF